MKEKRWGVFMLSAIVVGNMVGAGIFMLPTTLAKTASPLGILIAWIATGMGVLMLALVFGNLAIQRPDLPNGPQSHAYKLFDNETYGTIATFSMVWGYWVANWSSNVAILTSLTGYLSTFFPILQDGTILFSLHTFTITKGQFSTFLVCSSLLWINHFILLKSVHSGGKISFIATITKVLGFALFIFIALFLFDKQKMGPFYTESFYEGEKTTLFEQINNAAILTLWAFIGIESAVLLSNRAISTKAVKQATIFGLLLTLIIYIGISFLTLGTIPIKQLQQSERPLVDALMTVLGENAGYVMAILAIISLLGSLIGWILLSAEVAYQNAKAGLFLSIFAKENKHNSPSTSLWVTNGMSQLFIFSTISGSINEAYEFVITVATLAYLIPYLVSPLFQLKLIIRGQLTQPISNCIFAILGLVYAIWVIITGTSDLLTFALGIGLFFVGFLLYPFMKRSK
ncbi:MAG: amino acid permease [Bacillaceae bacterium]